MFKNLLRRTKNSFNSKTYWEKRYARGENSGVGSYNHLAEFKAEILNNFVKENNIQSVIEFGCGDGNQLSLAKYEKYIGLDVSLTAINICKQKFENDIKKSFFLYHNEAFVDNFQLFQCEMAISLDVIFHLVEEKIYKDYLIHLFQSASKYVVIYSSNYAKPNNEGINHVYHREFVKDIEMLFPNWTLDQMIPNKYPASKLGIEKGSFADFYIFVPTIINDK